MTPKARFLVLWETPPDPTAFDQHYYDVHVPLTKKLPGLRRYTLSRNVTHMRGDGPYYLVAELDFDDMASLRAAFQTPEGKAAAADAAYLAGRAPARSMIYDLEEME